MYSHTFGLAAAHTYTPLHLHTQNLGLAAAARPRASACTQQQAHHLAAITNQKMEARLRAELPSCRRAWQRGRAHVGHAASSTAAAAAVQSESNAGQVSRMLHHTGALRDCAYVLRGARVLAVCRRECVHMCRLVYVFVIAAIWSAH